MAHKLKINYKYKRNCFKWEMCCIAMFWQFESWHAIQRMEREFEKKYTVKWAITCCAKITRGIHKAHMNNIVNLCTFQFINIGAIQIMFIRTVCSQMAVVVCLYYFHSYFVTFALCGIDLLFSCIWCARASHLVGGRNMQINELSQFVQMILVGYPTCDTCLRTRTFCCTYSSILIYI